MGIFEEEITREHEKNQRERRNTHRNNVEKCSYSSDEMSAERKWYRCESRANKRKPTKEQIYNFKKQIIT